MLGNFRLLETARTSEVIANGPKAASSGTQEWWLGLAEAARTYRCAIDRDFVAIDSWSKCGRAPEDLRQERLRVREELRTWCCEVAGGRAYVTWLNAYVAAAELDGERALNNLISCAAVAQEFVDVRGLGEELSLYDFLQSAADALALFLPLPEHPVRDMHRFAFLPGSLRSRYGS